MSQPDFLYELFEDFMDDPANRHFSGKSHPRLK